MAKILIVDDEVLTLEMLSAFLKISGHEALEAIDTRQGWSILDYEKPEAILLDIQLPDGNGLHMCKQLREKPNFSKTPIIMISAHSPPKIKEAEQAGATDYLAKPIRLNVLQETLAKLL
jgi:DNA-binding response OmpR family regulator